MQHVKVLIVAIGVAALAMLCQGESFTVSGVVTWEEWKRQHNNMYYYMSDENAAKKMFNDTDSYIKSENAKDLPYKLGHNRFSALTFSAKKSMLGYQPLSLLQDGSLRQIGSSSVATTTTTKPTTTTTKTTTKPTTTTTKTTTTKTTTTTRTTTKPTTTTTAAPATSLDYRTSPCLQPIKDQGNCGSCWAFATIALVEFGHCVLTNQSIALSEQQLVDCDTSDHGCNGGSTLMALRYLAKANGSDTSASYPYTSRSSGVAGTCKNSSVTIGAKVSATTPVTTLKTVASMKAALQNQQLISVAFAVVNSFMQYASGIYAETNCKTNIIGYHAIALVGYNTNGSIPYWIGRNQWGTGWGQAGYIYFKMGANICQVESLGVYTTIVVA